MPPPTSYRVVARTRPGADATVDVATSTLAIDATWDAPATGAPGPAELLAAAFAACLLKNLARCRELLGFSFDDATVEVVARRQDTPPRFVEVTYQLEVVTAEPARRVELVHQNLRRFGTVYNTLAAVCEVHGTVTGVPAPAEAGRES